MSLAILVKASSFLTKGKIAALVGAKTAGNLSTVRSLPSSKVSSCKLLENTAKNILSNPIEVSKTYGV